MYSHHIAAELAAGRTRDLLAQADAARLARQAKQSREPAPSAAAGASQPGRRWSLRRRPAPC